MAVFCFFSVRRIVVLQRYNVTALQRYNVTIIFFHFSLFLRYSYIIYNINNKIINDYPHVVRLYVLDLKSVL